MQPEKQEFNEDSFYPYREQSKSGETVVPILDPGHELPPPSHKPSWLIIIIFLVILFFAFVLGYNTMARQRLAANPTPTFIPTWTPIPSATPLPAQKVSQFAFPELQRAYDQTMAAQTMKAAFISQVKTTSTKTGGESSTIDSKVEGYLFGSADGTTIQTELRISYDADPSRTAFFGQILVDNRLFMKVNEKDWEERKTSDYNKLYENQPIDATAYAYNILDTLFTRSKALLRGIDSGTVRRDPDEQIDGKKVLVYAFTLSTQDYLDALQRDVKTTAFTLEDAKKIMGQATANGKVYIDPATNYIVRISLSGNNFTQINTEQSALLGLTAVHSIEMIANLVDFNAPLSLKPPTQ